MHWFWRAAIAMVVGELFAILDTFLSVTFYSPWLQGRDAAQAAYTHLSVSFLRAVATSGVVIVVYGYLTHRYYKARLHADELRCRKCNYILRGLTEPRCPECGEGI